MQPSRNLRLLLGISRLAAPLVLTGCLLAPSLATAGFTDVTGSAGVTYTQHIIDFDNCLMGGMTTCAPEANTGGGAASDINGDGWVDLFVTRLHDTDILFCNDGDGTFTDCTAQTGLDAYLTHSNGAGFADIDNDGDQDLYVLTMGDPQFYLFINDGTGFFTEEAVLRGAAVDDAAALERAGMSVAFGDYDNDGYLDMFTTEWRQAGLVPQFTPSHSRLLHNLGAANPGHFEDVTVAADVVVEDGGAQIGYSVCFAAAFSDLDGDGWQDLAVTCDYNSSRLYWNDGDGTFTDGTVAAGVGIDWNGMGSSFGDADGDGDLDWFITAIYSDPPYNGSGTGLGSGNQLYINDGGRSFSHGTDTYGVRDGFWGWGAGFFDYDLDADPDIVMTNGYLYGPWLTDPIRLFRNDGTTPWVEAAAAEGITNTVQGRGLLFLDFDADGDLDFFVSNNQTTPVLYRNDNANGNAWLKVTLEGVFSNRDGIGAMVRVTPSLGGATQSQQIGGVTQFLAQSERVAHFGLGSATGPVHEVRVEWPSGLVSVIEDVALDQTLHVVEFTEVPTLPGVAQWLLLATFLAAGARVSLTRR